MKKILLILFVGILFGQVPTDMTKSTQYIMNKVWDSDTKVEGRYSSTQDVFNAIYNSSNDALNIRIIGGELDLTADLDTLKIDLGTELYAIDLEINDTRKFAVDTTGSGYFAGDVGIGTASPDSTLHVDGGTFLDGDLIVSGTISGDISPVVAHGKLVGANESGDNITVTTGGTYYKYTFTDSTAGTDGAHNVTYDDDLDRLTIQASKTGNYLIVATATASVDAGATIVHLGVGKNGTVGPFASQASEAQLADKKFNMSMTNIPSLVEGDYVEIFFTSENDADVITVYHANLSLVYLD